MCVDLKWIVEGWLLHHMQCLRNELCCYLQILVLFFVFIFCVVWNSLLLTMILLFAASQQSRAAE